MLWHVLPQPETPWGSRIQRHHGISPTAAVLRVRRALRPAAFGRISRDGIEFEAASDLGIGRVFRRWGRKSRKGIPRGREYARRMWVAAGNRGAYADVV